MADIFIFGMEINNDVHHFLQHYALLSINSNFLSVVKLNLQVNIHDYIKNKNRVKKNKTRKTNIICLKKTKLHVYLLEQTQLQ